MGHYTTRDDKYRGSPYPLGRSCAEYEPCRSVLHRANDYVKSLIQSIAETKLRRMRRELELRGIQFDGPNEEWIPSSLRKGNEAK
jgi:hypothetical protein